LLRRYSPIRVLSLLFFFSSPPSLRDLLSFPTRRSSDLWADCYLVRLAGVPHQFDGALGLFTAGLDGRHRRDVPGDGSRIPGRAEDRKSTRLNSSHVSISYAVFCLKKKKD